jgi:hypothetical protein
VPIHLALEFAERVVGRRIAVIGVPRARPWSGNGTAASMSSLGSPRALNRAYRHAQDRPPIVDRSHAGGDTAAYGGL